MSEWFEDNFFDIEEEIICFGCGAPLEPEEDSDMCSSCRAILDQQPHPPHSRK